MTALRRAIGRLLHWFLAPLHAERSSAWVAQMEARQAFFHAADKAGVRLSLDDGGPWLWRWLRRGL